MLRSNLAGFSCAAFPFDRQLDRELGLGLKDERRALGIRLHGNAEPFGQGDRINAPALGSLADCSGGKLFACFSVAYHPRARVDGDPVLFSERPANGFPRREIDLHRHVERVEEISEDDAGARRRLISPNAVAETMAAQLHVEQELRVGVGGPGVDERRCGRRADASCAAQAEQRYRGQLLAGAGHRFRPIPRAALV